MADTLDPRAVPVDGDGDQSFKDTITQACIFDGNTDFVIIARFHEGEIAEYFTEARCIMCGAWYKVPTPTDKEGISV